jgi:hypothetical protein
MWMLQGVRGLWLMPNSLWSVFRRVLTVLILAYGLLVAAIDPSVLDLRHGAALGAIMFGPSGLLTLITLLVYRKFGLLPYLPGYLGFRMLRAYFSLDMLFSLSLKPIAGCRRVAVEESRLEGARTAGPWGALSGWFRALVSRPERAAAEGTQTAE